MLDYSVAQVEAITGIKAHTLRVWERRYNFINPTRTKTNIRYYTDNELRMLINVSLLLKSGLKVSKIDKMTPDEINNKVNNIISNRDTSDAEEIAGLTLSMMNLDEITFNNIFQRLLIRKGLLKTITDVIYPFLSDTGFLWSSNKISPLHEHFISNLIRQKIIASTDTLPVTRGDAPGIVMFLPPGEDHEIGLLIANFIAKNLGWRVYYLGQNVPTNNLTEINNLPDVKFLLTMIITPLNDIFCNDLINLSEAISIPLLISGNHYNFGELANSKNVKVIPSPEDLIKILESE